MIMKKGKIVTLLLALLLAIPIFWNRDPVIVRAAAPAFTKTKLELAGEGKTYSLEIKNMVSGSTYKWSTSNKSVVKVTSKGVLTTVGKGTATVKCKITYPTKKTKEISCKVTVTVPAKDITITNATLKEGAHVMTVGSNYDFERELAPKSSSDETYWSVGGGDASCIRIDNAGEGTVTAMKTGKVILTATAAKAATAAAAASSTVYDSIIIEVVSPKATVNSAEIISSNQIKVIFDSPVTASTVITSGNILSSNIELTQRKDAKNILSNDPGALTASLSTDGKILTITAAKTFIGQYGINITSKVMTTDGLPLEPFYKTLSYVDNGPPVLMTTTYDDSGMVATLPFNEIMDFTNLKVSGAAVVSPVGEVASTATLGTLNNINNYVVSADKKSLIINLSKISSSDYNKLLSVILSGVTDASGNAPASYTVTAYIKIDTSVKAQAQLISLERSGYNTITASFSRAIQSPGYLQVNGGPSVYGVIDEKDNKKVNYTISDASATLTGTVNVSVGYWNSYNVAPGDASAQQMVTRAIYFTVDQVSPTYTYEYDSATNILTLTCNEDVVLTVPGGIFSASLITASDDIIQGNNITYAQVPYEESEKIIKLKLANMSSAGSYTFTIDRGFLTDKFKNPCLSKTIRINSATGTGSELPGPTAITQSSANSSEIYLEFAKKLDIATAENPSNYTIAGATIVSAKVTKNTSDSGATVVLTVADGTIDATVARPITIKGVKGYNNTYQPITTYTKSVELKENKKPYFIDPPVFDKNTRKTVKLTFSEAIQGTMTVRVSQFVTSGTPVIYNSSFSVTGSNAYITLDVIPVTGTYLKIDILSNNITDLSGNPVAAMSNTLGVVVSY